MKRTLVVFVAAFLLSAGPAFALTDADEAALKQLTKDYASWVYSGRPVEFRNRLDYDSYEEQRRTLLKLAELQWSGLWGDYWRRHGVSDLKTLREFSPKEFWLHFHSSVRPSKNDAESRAGRMIVEVHAITEARGLAYVVYQVTHLTRHFESDDDFLVLRARWSDGQWRLIAFPRVTADLRRQLDAVQSKKRTGR